MANAGAESEQKVVHEGNATNLVGKRLDEVEAEDIAERDRRNGVHALSLTPFHQSNEMLV